MLMIDEVAQKLHCSTKIIYKYLKEGKIKGVKIGNKWQVSEKELDYILENGLR